MNESSKKIRKNIMRNLKQNITLCLDKFLSVKIRLIFGRKQAENSIQEIFFMM